MMEDNQMRIIRLHFKMFELNCFTHRKDESMSDASEVERYPRAGCLQPSGNL